MSKTYKLLQVSSILALIPAFRLALFGVVTYIGSLGNLTEFDWHELTTTFPFFVFVVIPLSVGPFLLNCYVAFSLFKNPEEFYKKQSGLALLPAVIVLIWLFLTFIG